MEIDEIREEIKLKLTGGLLELELSDQQLDTIINSAFRELQRYITEVRLITIPYTSCIDMSKYNVKTVTNVYRIRGNLGGNSDTDSLTNPVDPIAMSQWQLLSGYANGYTLNNFTLNFAAWSTASQIRNTLSTDLDFRYIQQSSQLYINTSFDTPGSITIEYVPRFTNVNEIKTDFWIDYLIRMSLALTKITLGRIRGKYTQTNALWTLDAETMLNEGNEELNALREKLESSSMLFYPVD